MTQHRQHIHLIGIGGTGLSAIARVLLERGYTVTGSDRFLSPLALDLIAAGVQVAAGHQSENIAGADLVVRSSAIPDSNPEVAAAQAAGIPVLKRSQFLATLMAGQQVIAVAGTHGKTSTTAMIAWTLHRLGLDPSYIIGGTAKNLGSNAHSGQGSLFVIEADEYDRMFLGLQPDLAVVTYMEHDHPDCYPTLADYRQAFTTFVGSMRPGGALLAAFDNDEARRLVSAVPAAVTPLTYGMAPGADYLAANVARNERGGFDYDALFPSPVSDSGGRGWRGAPGEGSLLAHVSLQVPGEHNVRNSLSSLSVVHRLVLSGKLAIDSLQVAAQALSEFSGTGRRFDVQGVVNGITIIDDYGHHPTEINATLAAARARYPQARIWAVWQPHTFSRTLTLLPAFAAAFSDADRVLVTEIYPSREKAADFDHFSAAQVVAQMAHPAAQFTPSLEQAAGLLLRQLQPADVLLVFSAGDADQVSAAVLQGLKERSQA